MRIGYIYANIAGDGRYGSKIEVTRDGDKVRVSRWESSPAGGMDSDSPSGEMRMDELRVCKPEPKDIIGAIKTLIRHEVGAVIKTYGKPTKRFSWYGSNEKGLSLRLVKEALELTMEDDS